MNIFEYDYEEHMSVVKEEAFEDGRKEERSEIVHQMVLENISRNIILSVVRITEEELEKILEEN